MKTCFSLLALSLLFSQGANAQFAPQVGISGSTAIHKTDSKIAAWATKARMERGYVNIADKSLGKTLVGDESAGIGAADGEIVSLGDSGVITLEFDRHIINGSGPDFVVFENGFQDPSNPEMAFLELAFVEVSSDGEHFFRFPANSNTPTDAQIKGAGEYMDARLIHNLAGKYIAGYGTPFDLDDLKEETGLDINAISHVRIIDVIGSIDETYGQKDHSGNTINDPYPTPFPTGGFDFDAIGILNASTTIQENHLIAASIYPNPANESLHIRFKTSLLPGTQLVLSDMRGQKVKQLTAERENTIDLSSLSSGLYFISIHNTNGTTWVGKCSKI